VGSFPRGIAFDGAHIWATNAGGSTVTKLRASDGLNLGTFAVGPHPIAVSFDGTHLWVVNSDNNTVTKLRASDGSNQGAFPVGTGPKGVVSDGVSVFVSTAGGIVKLRASDGAMLAIFGSGPIIKPAGLAFDGRFLWVGRDDLALHSIFRCDTASSPPVCGLGVDFELSCNAPHAVAWDGFYVWAACRNGVVGKGRPVDFTSGGLGLFAAGSGPVALASDGANIWIANSGDGTVTRY
jgi:DNA-binding beta-propeller fold protein YncE